MDMAIVLHDGLCGPTRHRSAMSFLHDTTRPPTNCAGVVMVGLPLRGVRVFRQFAWLQVGSVKIALSRPTPSG